MHMAAETEIPRFARNDKTTHHRMTEHHHSEVGTISAFRIPY
jgi:hypothetical protein